MNTEVIVEVWRQSMQQQWVTLHLLAPRVNNLPDIWFTIWTSELEKERTNQETYSVL